LVTFLISFICAAQAVSAQEPAVSITPRENLHVRSSRLRPNLRIDSALVLLPVTVTDPNDHPIADLAPSSFRVFDDNIEQRIVSFQREDGPASVGFIFDASRSMKGRMDRSIAAINQFLKTLTKGDEFLLIRFSDRPTLISGFTEDSDYILSSLSLVQPEGWTALNDAICLGIQSMKRAKNSRRALFVLTDGGDNNSRYSESEVRSLVRESDVRIYSIGLFERPYFLEKLAMDTGARAIWARKLEDLPKVVEDLSRDFRNQYVLGYSPTLPQNDGKYHDVRLEIVETIKLKALHVFWRRGYFAPSE
jgi:VWFA-related protein